MDQYTAAAVSAYGMSVKPEGVGTLIIVRETGDTPWHTKDEMAFPSDRPIQTVIERVAFEGRPHHRLVIDLNPDGTFRVCNETVVGSAVIPRGRMRGTLGEGTEP